MTDERPQGPQLLPWTSRAISGWDQVQLDEGGHRRRAIVLAVVSLVLAALGLTVHTVFLAFAAVTIGIAAIEWAMWRRSRPVSRIPDYRPIPTVEVDLDDPEPTSGS